MSIAYRCDVCGGYFDGQPDAEVVRSEYVLYSDDGRVPYDDNFSLCGQCYKSFRAWVEKKRDELTVELTRFSRSELQNE